MYKIYLIGAGNVATQLGIALQNTGNQIVGVYSRTLESALVLGSKLSCAFTDDLQKIHQDADIYILCIKDDALVAGLSFSIPANTLVLHTSGSVEMSLLSRYSSNFGVFYPLFSFTKDIYPDWKNIPLCLESSDAKSGNILNELAKLLGGKIYQISSEQRSHLHLAAVWVNNFSNHLISVAEGICKTHDIPFEILEPIALETVKKAFSHGAQESQTGPALRSDRKTLEKHLRLIGEDELTSTLYIYLSKAIRASHFGD